MKILGISASGRDGITASLVEAVLKATGLPYEYVSLAGKQISGCHGCAACAGDNQCVIQDDWLELAEKMKQADAIVFGAPTYYGNIGALAHSFLERTYSFRHREVFPLAGKLGVAVGVGGAGADAGFEAQRNSPAIKAIRTLMEGNKMAVIDFVHATGYALCYTCGYGHSCGVGAVVPRHGYIDEITPEMHSPKLDCQPQALAKAERVGHVLGSILKARG